MISWLQLFLLLVYSPVSINHPPELNKAPVEEQTLKLVFAGDVMGHGPQIRSAQVIENQRYDYTACFKYIKPIIHRADIAIANLEVTLPGAPPYSGYPLFRSPDELAIALRQAGFRLLLTANNHSNDGGKFGVLQTINTLYRYGFYQTGSFQSKEEREAYHPLVIYQKGFKLAFLNYTYSTNGIATKPPTIVNIINEKEIEKDIATAKAMEADFITVIMHWGQEYKQYHNKDQEQLAKKMVAWGANLIVGAHPHVVQPIKWYPSPDQSSVPVAYSLGNFISNQQKARTDGGILFEVDLTKDKTTGKTTLKKADYHIIWRYTETLDNGKKVFMVIPHQKERDSTMVIEYPPLPSGAQKKMDAYVSGTQRLLKTAVN